ncbi:hypothetical protein JYG30_12550 [Fibrella sp. USSR17]
MSSRVAYNTDFVEFTKSVAWFTKSSDKLEFLRAEVEFPLTERFKHTFPVLSSLIKKARLVNLTINSQLYRLFSWTNKYEVSCGWLTKIEALSDHPYDLIDEHKLLLSEIGGIQESYNQPEPSLCNNQNFLFIESQCTKGLSGWEAYYREMCAESGYIEIDYSELICFVQEVNGNLTLYNPDTKKVILFAPDHCFNSVEFMKNQPEYTFHTINGITTFTDYVEALAKEWINEIN